MSLVLLSRAVADRFYRCTTAAITTTTAATSNRSFAWGFNTCIINVIFMFALAKRMIQSVASQRSVASVNYEEAIRCLNNLQSNAAYLNAAKGIVPTKESTLQDVKKYLIRSGITLEQLDGLSIIHVAGTKGKGSTCAFVETILRAHGFCTGFFSSPHLISVRERIRINGKSLNETEFTRQFWQVYKALDQKKEHENDMPQYFKFLTILMFHVFIKTNIDVAILEVGIGGEYDCTNIVNSSVCTGITSLSLDHTTLLGDTIEAIAWQKAGIFKPAVPAFTVPQSNDAMIVLQSRAVEKNCSLSVVPKIEEYPWRRGVPTLGIRSSVQSNNASLAIQLASTWMMKNNRIRRFGVLKSTENKWIIDEEPAKKTSLCFDKIAVALNCCKWPGRTQVLLGKSLDFYIDGAHTYESIECCVSWFRSNIQNERTERPKYLIFNTTGNRDSSKLMAPLKKLHFSKAYFVPNVAGICKLADQENLNVPVTKQKEKCCKHAEIWGENSVLADSIYETLQLIKEDHKCNSKNHNTVKPQVLVTGSLHLVGALLSVVDPDLTMSTTF
ncbi:folylpolyglutamate synthase, mitochondrial-like isoform X2 [Phymastichus coffea]|uniref:folylpolyglutamate synthase, mitochondrial-like isoform X2 n=1 Tax=Phymastichus coffea TaxID=108790 RepID=UPI00273BAC23|nr:folylpolyglutamate synthase, mitochondrial-like isoform X2 [Phymastichus coffea]